MHVSALLGCSVDKTEDSLKQSELLLTKQLIKTLQKNLCFQTVKFSFSVNEELQVCFSPQDSCLDEVESGTEFDYGKEELSKSHVSELLSGLQTHLLARCSMSEPQEGSSDLIIEKVFLRHDKACFLTYVLLRPPLMKS
jgi:hypothetical protein